MQKKSFFGRIALDVQNPESPFEEYDTKTLARIKRKLQTKGVQNFDAINHQMHISKATEDMASEINKNPKAPKDGIPFKRTTTTTAGGAARGVEGGYQAVSRYGMVAGHEMGHILDSLKHDKDFFGDRGVFGIGGDFNSMLKSERSASKKILKRLPPEVQRARGGGLGHAYQTYLSASRTNPKNQLIISNFPKKEEAPHRIAEKLKQGFEDRPENMPTLAKTPIYMVDDDTWSKQNNILARSDHNSYLTANRVIRNVNTSREIRESSRIPKFKLEEAQRLDRNKARLIQNATKLNQRERITALRQAAREVRDARKAFGSDVAGAVRNDFRAIASQVPPIPSQKTRILNDINSGIESIGAKLKSLLSQAIKFRK